MPILNEAFARKQGLSEETISCLNHLYSFVTQIQARPTHYYKSLSTACNVVDGLETTIQALWGFEYNVGVHYMSYDIVGCICGGPIDYSELFWANLECPVHKHKIKPK